MSFSTWTPAALSSDARRSAGTCWRLVEAQHRVSTLKLVDSVDEQETLEGLIQATKPALPPECQHLHYLLSTPFRYGAVYPTGSRFRRAGPTEGVFYAAEAPETNAAEYTAFSAEYATRKAIDLSKGRYTRDGALWMHPTDYEACQGFADTARSAGIEVIRYASVRDPRQGMNVALLTGRAFAKPKPSSQQTWHIRLSDAGAHAICESPRSRVTYDPQT